jgi:RNA polymerase sigma-70 factor (ECF subfamily)
MMSDQGPDFVALLPALLRYARSLTRDPLAAEDLVHDALVSALNHLASFDVSRSMRPWLFGIIHNQFISDVRREAVRQDCLGQLKHPPAASSPVQERREELRRVDLALAELPVLQREALHLVAVESLTYQQAADALGVPVGTVMSRVSRARRCLRQAQEHQEQPPASLRLVSKGKDR